MVGDLTNVFVRHDPRTLVGVPIAGAIIFYLAAARRERREEREAELKKAKRRK
jgi:hypothetical protein